MFTTGSYFDILLCAPTYSRFFAQYIIKCCNITLLVFLHEPLRIVGQFFCFFVTLQQLDQRIGKGLIIVRDPGYGKIRTQAAHTYLMGYQRFGVTEGLNGLIRAVGNMLADGPRYLEIIVRPLFLKNGQDILCKMLYAIPVYHIKAADKQDILIGGYAGFL